MDTKVTVNQKIVVEATAPVIDIYEAFYHKKIKQLRVGIDVYANASIQAANGPTITIPGIRPMYVFEVEPSVIDSTPIFEVAKQMMITALKNDLNTNKVS